MFDFNIEDLDVKDEELEDSSSDVNIREFSSEKLCAIIACNRYLGIYKDLAVSCMQELADRRINGDDFNFEEHIEKLLEPLPKLTFPSINNVMSIFRKNK